MMRAITCGLAAAIVLTAAAVGLAGPASADPLSGTFSRELLQGPPMAPRVWSPVTFTPCGPDCTHYDAGKINYDFVGQGTTWAASYPGLNGSTCNATLDTVALIETTDCHDGGIAIWQFKQV
jgi:hypothetical protein